MKRITALKGSSFNKHIEIILDLIAFGNNSMYFDDDNNSSLETMLKDNPRRNFVVFCSRTEEVRHVVERAKQKGIKTVRVDSIDNQIAPPDEKDYKPIHVHLTEQLMRYYDEKELLVVTTIKTSMAVETKYLVNSDSRKWTCIYTDTSNESSTQRVTFDKNHRMETYLNVDPETRQVSLTDVGASTEINWSLREKVLYPIAKEKVSCIHIYNGDGQKETFITEPRIDYYPDNAVVCISDVSRWGYFDKFRKDIDLTQINVERINFKKKVNIHFYSKMALSAYKKEQYKGQLKKILAHYHDLLGDDVVYVKNKNDDPDFYPEEWESKELGNLISGNFSKVFITFHCNLTKKEKKDMETRGMSADRWYTQNYVEPLRKFFIHFVAIEENKTVDIVVPDENTAITLKNIFGNEYGCDVSLVQAPIETNLQKGYRSDRKWPENITATQKRKINFMVKKYEDGEYEGYPIHQKIADLMEEKWKIAQLPDFKKFNTRGNFHG